MKKIFPLITVLVILSLIGLAIIQVQWFSSLITVQGEKIQFKAEKGAMDVVQELSKQSSASGSMRLQRKNDLNLLPDNLSFIIPRAPSVAERYTEKEIYTLLSKSFEKEELKSFRFEFGIAQSETTDIATLEMQSKNFLQESLDTVHNRKIIIPITPAPGTELEGLVAYEHLIIVLPDFKTQVWQSVTLIIFGAALFNLIIFFAFFLTIRTLLNQRRLNATKSDFINNMTHELKTPLATISLAVDALKNEKVIGDKEKMQYFSSIIKDENKRMNKHVETILQAGLMDRQDIRIVTKPVHVHNVINNVVENFNLQLQEKGGAAILQLNAKHDVVEADENHFTNIISNLVDNSIKYSKEKDPIQIKFTTHATPKHLVIQLEDNGIGMSKETSKRIFEKFYRAHTGNVHNVKGFGLGMSYVKTIIDALKGKIKVESVLGKGSTFTIELPLAQQS